MAQFKYLGTTVTTDGRYTKEINKRIGERRRKCSKIPTIEELLREKRRRWFGHLMREKENGLPRNIDERKSNELKMVSTAD